MNLEIPIQINAMDVAKEFVEDNVVTIYNQGAKDFAEWFDNHKYNYARSAVVDWIKETSK